MKASSSKTASKLQSLNLRDLAQLAKKQGVRGWHDMRKDQLLAALTSASKKPAATSRSATPAPPAAAPAAKRAAVASSGSTAVAPARVAAKPAANGHPAIKRPESPKRSKSPVVVKRLAQARLDQERSKNLAFFGTRHGGPGFAKDRLVVMVRDPFWLHAYWELTRHGVQRAEAAMGQDWHTARPVIRLLDVSSNGTTSTAEVVLRHVEVHGGVNNWYIDIQDQPRSYRMDIGYLSSSGKYYMLARSNIVTPPRADTADAIDQNWAKVAENFDKIYAMSGGYSQEGSAVELQELFEERLRRPMGSPVMTRFGNGVEPVVRGRLREFEFQLDAELIVYGHTEKDAHVTLQGDPVALRPDGTFTVRFALPNCRQVIPAVASSADGAEQRTIVLAVERNTKVMEPVTRDQND